MDFSRSAVYLALAALLSAAVPASATEWFVAPGGSGNGVRTAPFGRVQDGIKAAQAGDIISVLPGMYPESLATVRDGLPAMPILLRAAEGAGSVVVTARGRVLRIDHAHMTVEGVVLDGQYGAADTVVVNSGAHFLTLRDTEVRRSSRDLVDIAGPHDVLIERCLIHHALNAADGRTDAHGVVAGAARNLTIRDTEIHTFSGDGFQIDPNRGAPGWDQVTIEGSTIWLAPLPAAENGFAAGTVPGENAVDTKVGPMLPRPTITIRDTVAWGFRGGLITNMAAFNLKEDVNALVDRVTVYDSEIAFRLRGRGAEKTGAWVTITNAVVYDTAKAFRYEDNLQNLRIWNSTLGRGVTSPFQAALSGRDGLEVRNLLLLGSSLPVEASHPSNRTAAPDNFVDVSAHNYALVPGASAIDSGVAIADVMRDRAGTERPQGAAFDVGAFEWAPARAAASR
ncbi:MAG: hypothetical protein HOP16_16025 [Acidobacteria bacterium]|nr:hypothetical protein [Acidobacteriota bacterium]